MFDAGKKALEKQLKRGVFRASPLRGRTCLLLAAAAGHTSVIDALLKFRSKLKDSNLKELEARCICVSDAGFKSSTHVYADHTQH